MITGTIRGELPDSDANLPLLRPSPALRRPQCGRSHRRYSATVPDIEPAIIDDLREETAEGRVLIRIAVPHERTVDRRRASTPDRRQNLHCD